MEITQEWEDTVQRLFHSKACRVVFGSSGRHLFGGKPAINYIGIDPPALIHHFMTIDTADRFSPLRITGIRYIPLVYPLAYSQGGGEAAYRVKSDGRIELLYLSEYSEDDPKYFELDALPQRSATLKPLTYAERRISGSDVRPLSFVDKLRMKRLWNNECFRIGGPMDMNCNLEHGLCDTVCAGQRFAYFPATKLPFGDIWHEYTSDVWFCFAMCTFCGTIHAYNECT